MTDRYELLGSLGQGNSGAVYRAQNVRLGNDVALKVMHPDPSGDESIRARFWREAKAVSMLEHEHLVSLIDYGITSDQRYFIALEYIPGETLATVLAGGQRLHPVDAAKIARQIALGLEHMHSRGLIHRDLKPGNVMLTEPEGAGLTVKIVDLGLVGFGASAEDDARLTQPGCVTGTPFYMAPERITGGPGDARTDLYALGVLLYQTLSGRVPFDGDIQNVLCAHIACDPAPITDGGPLAELALALMRKDPDERPSSAREVIDTLDIFLEAGQLARPDPLDTWFEENEEVASIEEPAEPKKHWWRTALLVAAAVTGCVIGASFASERIHFQSPIVLEVAAR